MHLIHAAISNGRPHLQKFNILNTDTSASQQSSLAKPSAKDENGWKRKQGLQIVPVFTLEDIISLVPIDIEIEVLKTDM